MVGMCIACLPLVACGRASVSEETASRAVKVEHIEGSDLSRVTLTEQAAKRLDIQTAVVRTVLVRGALRKVIPYAAILYDTEGHTWAYTMTGPLTFVRSPVTVDYIEGDVAVLTEGPVVGMTVVTVGAAELYGSEEEFEEE
jgi:hypothetical protein